MRFYLFHEQCYNGCATIHLCTYSFDKVLCNYHSERLSADLL
nr:MAG TPA: hypothetical protein [Bacteriophage sp.]